MYYACNCLYHVPRNTMVLLIWPKKIRSPAIKKTLKTNHVALQFLAFMITKKSKKIQKSSKIKTV